MKTKNYTIIGIRPIIQHNGLLADPTNSYVRKIKEYTGKRKKTDSDYEQIEKLEWEGSLYYNKESGPYIPAVNIERCIIAGAKKSRLGKDFDAGVMIDGDEIPLEYDGPRELSKLKKDPAFKLKCGVVINRARIMKVRPIFPTGWKLSFSVMYDEGLVNTEQLDKAIEDGGLYSGLGDWRPRFGRFIIGK